jgi:aminoglycoside phosphotransferase (APT) family kinase protein
VTSTLGATPAPASAPGGHGPRSAYRASLFGRGTVPEMTVSPLLSSVERQPASRGQVAPPHAPTPPGSHAAAAVRRAIPDQVAALVRSLAGPGATRWTFPPQGESGTRCAVVRFDGGGWFVKWADPGDTEARAGLRREAENLHRVRNVLRRPALLAADGPAAALVLELVDADRAATWDRSPLGAAFEPLAALRSLDATGLDRVQDWKAFRDRGELTRASLRAAGETNSPFIRFVLAGYGAVRQWPGPLVLCHGDAHPGNWILSSQGPVLVDLGRLAAGPAGFDETFLTAHLSLPAEDRHTALLEAGVSPALAAAVACAVAGRIAVGMAHADLPSWQRWCATRWAPARSLARSFYDAR